MATRPAKRQRRLTIFSSSDEEEGDSDYKSDSKPAQKSTKTSQLKANQSQSSSFTSKPVGATLPSRSKPRITSTNTQRKLSRSLSTASPTPSPEKKRKSAINKKGKPEEPSKSLHSFFQPATEEQRWQRRKAERDVPPSSTKVEDRIEEEDLIEDDFSDDELLLLSQLGTNGNNKNSRFTGDTVGGRRLEKPKLGPKASGVKKPTTTTTAAAKKRFILPTSPVPEQQPSSKVSGPEELQPWAERFAPSRLDELAVHKRKVTDVQRWLEDVFLGRNRRRLLVLKGPSGSGKTTTISLLSKVLGYNVIEWKNPLASEYATQGYTSMASQFEEFLGRSGKFGSLDLDGTPQGDTKGKEESSSEATGRRIILVEEFPSSLSHTSVALKSFRAALLRYLAASIPSQGLNFQSANTNADLNPPVVIIVSETLLSTSTSLSDNFTAHRLLGPEMSNHSGVNIIEFNPIAPTYMTKALDLVLKKEARCSMRKNIPGPAVLKRYAELGDVRSAVSSLEFLCIRGDDAANWGGRVAVKKKKKGEVDLTAMEKESLEMLSQREASLGIFHAVGRVMYNKREDPSLALESKIRLPPPPAHLRHHSRLKISEVSIDDLINEIGTDTQTFISGLHENYVPSCNGRSFTQSLEGCIEALSESDILGPDSRRGLQSNRSGIGSARGSYQGYGAGIDILRQDEISFHVSVRGMLFSLPHPVHRRIAQSGGAHEAFKMFYPTSLRLWKETEEVSGLLDTWVHRVTDPHSAAGRAVISSSTASEREGVGSWKSRRLLSRSATAPEDTSDEPAIARTMISRDDLLLERLPYLTKISTDKALSKELEKITQFNGISSRSESSPDEDFDAAMDHQGLQSPQKSRQHWAKQKSENAFGPKLPPSVEDGVEKLFLSDDDIEDD